MAWNEPSGNNNGNNKKSDYDPWKRNKNSQGNRQSDDDLDLGKTVSDLLDKLFAKKHNGGFGNYNNNNNSRLALFLAGVILIAIVVFVVTPGFYTLTEAQQAVVLRFGSVNRIETSGLHWAIPYVEKVNIVDVNQVRVRQSSGSMLTRDENVVDVEITVQYIVTKPKEYLYSVANPESSLDQAIDSALRYVVGHTSMDEVLTNGISEVRMATENLLVEIIDRYDMGITINSVVFKAKAPDAVKDAFNDAISAQEDEQRFKSEANAYKNDIIPKAEGKAARLIEEAEAYRLSVVNKASGDVARFNQLLPEYALAPEVTKKRIFLETMESVYVANPKVLINVDNSSGSMLYLPLDQLLKDQKLLRGQN